MAARSSRFEHERLHRVEFASPDYVPRHGQQPVKANFAGSLLIIESSRARKKSSVAIRCALQN
jgi:hypothetical protein